MNQRLLFMIGFGSLGILPLLQLFFLWKFCEPETVGRTLFASTVALFLSAFCDGTSSYRGPSASHDNRHYLLDVVRIRVSRLILTAPFAALALVLFGKPPSDACAAALLAGAYGLSFAFVERNFGSITRALKQEYAARLTCLLLPAAGASMLGAETGLLLGCASALLCQALAFYLHTKPRSTELRPSIRAAFSRDLLSGLLSLFYASFSQMATAALLAPTDFARFITIDRLVRAGLLVTEPARLLYLRRSWATSAAIRTASILASAVVVAIVSTSAVALMFLLELPRRILGIEHGPTEYVLVCFLASIVSFTTLCGFVRFDALRTVNWLLGVGLVAGISAFLWRLPTGPFQSALAFECLVCAVIVVGAVVTDFGRRQRPRPL